jgi:hypothetical protein
MAARSRFVALGLFRYLFFIYRRQDWGNPTGVSLSDLPSQVAMERRVGALGCSRI